MAKIFWEDEFFTLYLSRIPNWHGLLTALSTGADQHPPSFYLLTHEFMKLFGTTPLTIRLPAVLGFWLLCVCLYEVVRSVTDPLWGVVAMLFPLTTNFCLYATEARGYGPEAGFVALALLSWLHAASDERRRVFLPLLGLSLVGAVSMHYYAAAVVACLGAGELVRWREQRHIDVPVLVALGCGFLPVLVFVKIIRKAHGYSGHFWAVPAWSDVVNFYKTEVSGPLIAILGMAGVLYLVHTSLRRGRVSGFREPRRTQGLAAWQATAFCALAALPGMVMVAAKFITHGFSDRYAIGALVGIATLVCCVLYRIAPQGYMALGIAAVCGLLSVLEFRDVLARVELDRAATGQTIRVLEGIGDQPIDVTEVSVFYRVSFYAPRELASRVEYVADPNLAIQYLNQDTLDRGLLDLRPWFPLKTMTLKAFQSQDQDFVAYGEANKWSWFSYELPKFGDARLLGRDHNALLFSVKRSMSDDLPSGEPSGAATPSNNVPASGASLCDLYMSGAGCY